MLLQEAHVDVYTAIPSRAYLCSSVTRTN